MPCSTSHTVVDSVASDLINRSAWLAVDVARRDGITWLPRVPHACGAKPACGETTILGRTYRWMPQRQLEPKERFSLRDDGLVAFHGDMIGQAFPDRGRSIAMGVDTLQPLLAMAGRHHPFTDLCRTIAFATGDAGATVTLRRMIAKIASFCP